MAIAGSPGVTIKETDQSLYVSGSSGATAAIIGPARKGPMQPTLISSQGELVDIFGTPLDGDYALLSAYYALTHCSKIFYTRVVHWTEQGEEWITTASKATAGVAATEEVTPGVKAFLEFEINSSVSMGNTGSVVIGDTTFVYAATGNGTSTFSTYAEFIALLQSSESLLSEFEVTVGTESPGYQIKISNKVAGVAGNSKTLTSDVTGIASAEIEFAGGVDPIYSGVDKFSFVTTSYDSTMNGKKIVILEDPIVDSMFNIIILNDSTISASYRVSVQPRSEVYFGRVLERANAGFEVTYNPFGGRSLPTMEAPLVFSGGVDGSSNLVDLDIIGQDEDKGIRSLMNPEAYSIKFIATPGWNSSAVIGALVSAAESRLDTQAFIHPPLGRNGYDASRWANGEIDNIGYVINSSKVACHSPWIKMLNPFTGMNEWVPPTGYYIAIQAEAYDKGDIWKPAAGFERGRMPLALDVYHQYTKGERDVVYGDSNIINCIVNFVGRGIVVWGQKTASRRSSVLNRLGPRMLLNEIERAVAELSKDFVFEDNIDRTWDRWEMAVDTYLRGLQAAGGIVGYKVVMDKTTVTPANIDAYNMPGKIYLDMTRQGEYIPIEFILTRSGIIFSEED